MVQNQLNSSDYNPIVCCLFIYSFVINVISNLYIDICIHSFTLLTYRCTQESWDCPFIHVTNVIIFNVYYTVSIGFRLLYNHNYCIFFNNSLPCTCKTNDKHTLKKNYDKSVINDTKKQFKCISQYKQIQQEHKTLCQSLYKSIQRIFWLFRIFCSFFYITIELACT